MLFHIGRGFAPLSPRTQPYLLLDFLGNDPRAQISISRAGAATYFDAEGKLASASSNTARLQHEFPGGRRQGLLIEHARVAYNHYARPQSGSLSDHFTSTPAGLSVVSDPSAPITNDFNNHDQVWEFANTSGGSVNLEWNGAIGSTSYICSAQLFYKITAGDNAEISIAGAGAKTLASTVWARGIASNIQPASTADKLRLTVPDNTTIRFFMANIQRDSASIIDGITSCVTMPVDSAGAATTRNADIVTADLENFSDEVGAIVFHATLHGFATSASRGIFGVAKSSSPLIRHSLLYTDDVDLIMNQYDGSSSASTEFRSNNILPQTIALAYRYGAGNSAICESGKITAMTPLSTMPSGIDLMTLYRPDVSSAVPVMVVQKVALYDTPLSDTDLRALARNARDTELRVVGAGQSNIAHQTTLYAGAGKAAFESKTRDQYLNDSTFTNGATGGTAAHASADEGSGYWFDPGTNTTGSAYTAFLSACDLAGRSNIDAVIWGQGETDAKALTAGTITKDDYKNAVFSTFCRMRADLGQHLQIYIQMLGSTDVSDALITDAGFQDVRDVQLELISAHSWIHRAGTAIDLTRADNYHLNQAGYETIAIRNACIILAADGKQNPTGTQGPAVQSATYQDDVVTVSVSHDGGTSLSGTETGAWRLTDDGADVAISGISYPDSSTISLTLGAAIAQGSNVSLWYGYGKMNGITSSNICRDNNGMPLQEISALEVAGI